MSHRDETIAMLKEQLEQWSAQLSAWDAAARSATADAKAETEKQVGILKSRLDDMLFRMEQLQGASLEAWEEIARGTEDARKAMHEAFDKARARFKQL
jgi:hypothetical protein